ncbi:MAG: hypothetical protein CMK89_00880 [Pseudomonadales bacterium]|nr:hypothetical protein [Pseudomonadales bacterium]
MCLLLLSACGGGGGDGSGGNTGGDNFPEVDLSGPEFDQYSGSTSAAILVPRIMDTYVSVVLSDTLSFLDGEQASAMTVNALNVGGDSEPEGETNLAARFSRVNETILCKEGGTETTTGDVGELTGSLTIHYEQCNDGASILHGDVVVNILSYDLYNLETNSFFKKLLITENGHTVSLSGQLYSFDDDENTTERQTANLVLVDTDSGAQIKLQNFRTYECQYCNNGRERTYEGRIYHSEYGYVDVTTPEVLISDNDDPINDPSSGQLRFQSSQGQVFLVTYEYIEVYRDSTINVREYLVHVELDENNDGVVEHQAYFPIAISDNYEIYDISDSDGDEMPDGWERLFGFDETDSSDAELDSDQDGYQNRVEYIKYGNPIDETILPVVSNLSMDLSLFRDQVKADETHSIIARVRNPNITYGALDITVTIAKSSNVEWGDLGRCKLSNTNPNEVTCPISSIRPDFGSSFSVGLTGEPGEFTVTATLSSASDFDSSNNSDQLTAEFLQRESDLGLVRKLSSLFNSDQFDVAVIDYQSQMHLMISQWGGDAHNSVFRMSLPEHVDVVAARYFIGDQSGDCDIVTEVVCELGIVPSNGGTYKGYVELDLIGISEGFGEYTASITSDSIELQPNDNSFTQRIFVGKSMLPYQTLIDNADSPLTIDLEPGMYVGALNFSDKEVTLNGGSGREATIIRARSPIVGLDDWFNVGDNGVVRNITFVGRDYFGADGHPLRIYGSDVLIENNIFEHNGSGGGVESWGIHNITIRNNIFRNAKAHDYGCIAISLGGDGSYLIENNLILNTECVAMDVSRYGNNSEVEVTHVVTNNTIVNNQAGIVDTIAYEGSNFVYQNNILAGNIIGIRIRDPYPRIDDVLPDTLQPIRNNIFFDNLDNVLVDSSLNLEFQEDGTNIYLSPLFVDEAASDYEQSPESPAIDAGRSELAPVSDFRGLMRPLDGDGDGFMDIDIGAYEYQ